MTTILSVQAVKTKSRPDEYVRWGGKGTRNLQMKQPRWYQYKTWYILVLYFRKDIYGEPNHNQCWQNWGIIRLHTRTSHHFLGRQILASPPLWSQNDTDLRAHKFTHSPDLLHQRRLANVTCPSSWGPCGINPTIPNFGKFREGGTTITCGVEEIQASVFIIAELWCTNMTWFG